MVAMCLVKDQTKRPTAEKLLKHSCFKNTKPPELAVKSLFADLPPLWTRVKSLQVRPCSLFFLCASLLKLSRSYVVDCHWCMTGQGCCTACLKENGHCWWGSYINGDKLIAFTLLPKYLMKSWTLKHLFC